MANRVGLNEEGGRAGGEVRADVTFLLRRAKLVGQLISHVGLNRRNVSQNGRPVRPRRSFGGDMPTGPPHIGKALQPPILDHQRVRATNGASGGGKTLAPALQNALRIHADAGFH